MRDDSIIDPALTWGPFPVLLAGVVVCALNLRLTLRALWPMAGLVFLGLTLLVAFCEPLFESVHKIGVDIDVIIWGIKGGIFASVVLIVTGLALVFRDLREQLDSARAPRADAGGE